MESYLERRQERVWPYRSQAAMIPMIVLSGLALAQSSPAIFCTGNAATVIASIFIVNDFLLNWRLALLTLPWWIGAVWSTWEFRYNRSFIGIGFLETLFMRSKSLFSCMDHEVRIRQGEREILAAVVDTSSTTAVPPELSGVNISLDGRDQHETWRNKSVGTICKNNTCSREMELHQAASSSDSASFSFNSSTLGENSSAGSFNLHGDWGEAAGCNINYMFSWICNWFFYPFTHNNPLPDFFIDDLLQPWNVAAVIFVTCLSILLTNAIHARIFGEADIAQGPVCVTRNPKWGVYPVGEYFDVCVWSLIEPAFSVLDNIAIVQRILGVEYGLVEAIIHGGCDVNHGELAIIGGGADARAGAAEYVPVINENKSKLWREAGRILHSKFGTPIESETPTISCLIADLAATEQISELEDLFSKFSDDPERFVDRQCFSDLEKMQAILSTLNGYSKRVDQEILHRIRRERDQLQQQIQDQRVCVVCQDNEKDVLFMPCRHICVCENCREGLVPYRCPLCNSEVHAHLNKLHF